MGATYDTIKYMPKSLDELKKLKKLEPLVVHKLRTPLTTIRMYSEALLTDEHITDPTVKDYLKEIHDASLRMGDVLTILDPTTDQNK